MFMAYCWIQTPALKRWKRSMSPQRPLLECHWGDTKGTSAAEWKQVATDWTLLPPEILAFLFGFLSSIKDRGNVQLVCRSWNGAMNLKSLWKNSTICIRKAAFASGMSAQWLCLQAKGITQFSISCIRESNLTSFMKRLVDYAPGTTSLELVFNESTDMAKEDLLSALSRLQCLQKLTLSGKGTQRLFHMNALFDSLPALQELSLFGIFDVCLQSVRHKKLQVLILENLGCLKSSETSALLSQLPCLERLEIKACSYVRWCFNSSFQSQLDSKKSKRDKVENVTMFSLAQTSFDGSEVSFPQRLLFLQSLDLSSCHLEKEHLSNIVGQLLYLKELNLSGNDCTDDVLLKLTCPLESIELKMCHKVTEAAVRHLATISSSVTHLGLGHCSNVKASLLSIMHKLFPALQYLDLSGWQGLNPDNFRCLRKLPCLKTVVVLDILQTQLPLRAVQNFRKHFSNKCSVVTPDCL